MSSQHQTHDPHPGIARAPWSKPAMAALLSTVVLVGLGERMAERFLPLYLMALGGGAFSVGLLNGMDNLLSALYSFPGGYVSDRLGYKRALAVFNGMAILGYLIVILFATWPAVIAGAVLFLSWTAISLPASMDMIASILPADRRTMGVSLHALVRRIPMALGPLLGGALIGRFGEQTGVRLAFAAALLLAGAALFLQQAMISPSAKRPEQAQGNPLRAVRLINPALRTLLVSDILVRFCEQIPYAFVVVWCVRVNGITPLQFGLLTAIEMVTAMLVYLPVAYLADRTTKKPFVVATFAFFTLFPLVLLLSRVFWMMVVAFVVRGMKEFGEPTRKALILDLAPDGRKAATFGVYYLVRDLVVSVAAFGGALLWDPGAYAQLIQRLGVGQKLLPVIERVASPTTNLLAAFAFGLTGTIIFALVGKGTETTELRKERAV